MQKKLSKLVAFSTAAVKLGNNMELEQPHGNDELAQIATVGVIKNEQFNNDEKKFAQLGENIKDLYYWNSTSPDGQQCTATPYAYDDVGNPLQIAGESRIAIAQECCQAGIESNDVSSSLLAGCNEQIVHSWENETCSAIVYALDNEGAQGLVLQQYDTDSTVCCQIAVDSGNTELPLNPFTAACGTDLWVTQVDEKPIDSNLSNWGKRCLHTTYATNNNGGIFGLPISEEYFDQEDCCDLAFNHPSAPSTKSGDYYDQFLAYCPLDYEFVYCTEPDGRPSGFDFSAPTCINDVDYHRLDESEPTGSCAAMAYGTNPQTGERVDYFIGAVYNLSLDMCCSAGMDGEDPNSDLFWACNIKNTYVYDTIEEDGDEKSCLVTVSALNNWGDSFVLPLLDRYPIDDDTICCQVGIETLDAQNLAACETVDIIGRRYLVDDPIKDRYYDKCGKKTYALDMEGEMIDSVVLSDVDISFRECCDAAQTGTDKTHSGFDYCGGSNMYLWTEEEQACTQEWYRWIQNVKFHYKTIPEPAKECCKWAFQDRLKLLYHACEKKEEITYSDDATEGCQNTLQAYWWPGSKWEILKSDRISATECCEAGKEDACGIEEENVFSWPANDGSEGCGLTVYQIDDAGERHLVTDGPASNQEQCCQQGSDSGNPDSEELKACQKAEYYEMPDDLPEGQYCQGVFYYNDPDGNQVSFAPLDTFTPTQEQCCSTGGYGDPTSKLLDSCDQQNYYWWDVDNEQCTASRKAFYDLVAWEESQPLFDEGLITVSEDEPAEREDCCNWAAQIVSHYPEQQLTLEQFQTVLRSCETELQYFWDDSSKTGSKTLFAIHPQENLRWEKIYTRQPATAAEVCQAGVDSGDVASNLLKACESKEWYVDDGVYCTRATYALDAEGNMVAPMSELVRESRQNCCTAYAEQGEPESNLRFRCAYWEVYVLPDDLPDGQYCKKQVLPYLYNNEPIENALPISEETPSRRECCDGGIMSSTYDDPTQDPVLATCPHVKIYTWDNANQKCTYDENVHFWTWSGDDVGEFGRQTKNDQQTDKSECCQAGVDSGDRRSPLLWACEAEDTFAFTNLCKKTVWALDSEGQQHAVLETDNVGQQECCAVGLDLEDLDTIGADSDLIKACEVQDVLSWDSTVTSNHGGACIRTPYALTLDGEVFSSLEQGLTTDARDCCAEANSGDDPDNEFFKGCDRATIFTIPDDLPEGTPCQGNVMPRLDDLIDWATPFSTFEADDRQCCEAGFLTGDATNPLLDSCATVTTFQYRRGTCSETVDFLLTDSVDRLNTGVLDDPRDASECCQKGLESGEVALLRACESESVYGWDEGTAAATVTVYALKADGERVLPPLDQDAPAAAADACAAGLETGDFSTPSPLLFACDSEDTYVWEAGICTMTEHALDFDGEVVAALRSEIQSNGADVCCAKGLETGDGSNPLVSACETEEVYVHQSTGSPDCAKHVYALDSAGAQQLAVSTVPLDRQHCCDQGILSQDPDSSLLDGCDFSRTRVWREEDQTCGQEYWATDADGNPVFLRNVETMDANECCHRGLYPEAYPHDQDVKGDPENLIPACGREAAWTWEDDSCVWRDWALLHGQKKVVLDTQESETGLCCRESIGDLSRTDLRGACETTDVYVWDTGAARDSACTSVTHALDPDTGALSVAFSALRTESPTACCEHGIESGDPDDVRMQACPTVTEITPDPNGVEHCVANVYPVMLDGAEDEVRVPHATALSTYNPTQDQCCTAGTGSNDPDSLLLEACDQQTSYAWDEQNDGQCRQTKVALNPDGGVGLTMINDGPVNINRCCTAAIDTGSPYDARLGACETYDDWTWDTTGHRWQHTCTMVQYAMDPAGGLGTVLNAGDQARGDQQCCAADPASGACQRTFAASGLGDASIKAALKEFFDRDWDYSGFLQEWEFMHYEQRWHSTIGKDWFGGRQDFAGNWYVNARNCPTFASARLWVESIISASGKPRSETYDAQGYGYATLDHYLKKYAAQFGTAKRNIFGVEEIWYWIFKNQYAYDNTFEYSMDRATFVGFVTNTQWNTLTNGKNWNAKFDKADKNRDGRLGYDEWYDFWTNISDIRSRPSPFSNSREAPTIYDGEWANVVNTQGLNCDRKTAAQCLALRRNYTLCRAGDARVWYRNCYLTDCRWNFWPGW